MKVFISHAYADKALARKVAEVLTEAGHTVWWDEQALPGDNWAALHAEALDRAEAMVVLLSPAALQSQEVRSDLSFALGKPAYKDRLIPIVISSNDLLEYGDIPWVLKRMKTISLEAYSRPEEAFKQIAENLSGA